MLHRQELARVRLDDRGRRAVAQQVRVDAVTEQALRHAANVPREVAGGEGRTVAAKPQAPVVRGRAPGVGD